MIFRSPCHCDRPLPRWTVPVHPATIYVFPRPIPGVPEAFQEQEWAPDFRQLWTVPGTPPPHGRNWLFEKGGEWCSVSGVSSLLLQELILLLMGKGKEAAFQELSLAGTLRPASAVKWHRQGAAHTLVCCPRWKQDEAEAGKKCSSLTNAPSGRPRTKQKVQKK